MAAFYLIPGSTFLQLFTDTGVIGSGLLIWTYTAGTSTPCNTYTDSTGVTPNSNPIILASNGRLNNVAIWVAEGQQIKIVVTTNVGTPSVPVAGITIGPTYDELSGTDDPTFTLAYLSNPVSGFGADLVANVVRSYDLISTVRAANVPAPLSGQTVAIDILYGASPGDGLGGIFYWNSTSSAADDGVNVIKPTAETGNGRYLRQVTVSNTGFTATIGGCTALVTSPMFAILANDNSVTLTLNAAFTGISNANALTFFGLPTAFRPSTTRIVPCMLEDSTTFRGGWATLTNSTTITFGIGFDNNPSGFTTSGTKGFPLGWTIRYPL